MRYILLSAAAIAVALIGFYRASLFSGRVIALEAFIASLSQLGLLISYEALPLYEASDRLQKTGNAAAPFWAALRERLLDSPDVQTAWDAAMRAAKATERISALFAEDEAILSEFAAGLGRSDVKTQLSGIELATERLRPHLTRAKAQSDSRGKVARSLGVLGALAIFILLM